MLRSWNSSRTTTSNSLNSGSPCSRAVRMPSVATSNRVLDEKRRSKRICHPISSPIVQPRSNAMRRARARAAIRRGCSRIVRPSAIRDDAHPTGPDRARPHDSGAAAADRDQSRWDARRLPRAGRRHDDGRPGRADVGDDRVDVRVDRERRLHWLGIMATNRKNDDDIDYTVEGATPPHEKDDPTNAGYDEAAHSGPGRYGVQEGNGGGFGTRSEEHTSELQSPDHIVCRLLLEKKNT